MEVVARRSQARDDGMATYPTLRQTANRPVESGRFGLWRVATAAAVVLATAALGALGMIGDTSSPTATPPGFLRAALGSSDARAPLVRHPAPGVQVAILNSGLRVSAPQGAVALTATSDRSGQPWQHHSGGALRRTAAGSDAIVFDGKGLGGEQFLTVARRQGTKVWRWRLETPFSPRVGPDGAVGFFAGQRMVSQWIPAPRILDAHGRDVTPAGVRWAAVRSGGTWWLELRLDDAKLSLPYTIDPAVLRTAGSVAAGSSIVLPTIPNTAVAQDLLILHVAQKKSAVPATPGGWTLVPGSGTTLGAGANSLGVATFFKRASSTDHGTTVSITVTAAAVAEVFVYRGVDTSLSNSACPGSGCVIRQTSAITSGKSTNASLPALTTAIGSELVIGAGSSQSNGTWPATGGSYTRQSLSAWNNGTSVSLALYDQTVANSSTTVPSQSLTIGASSVNWTGFTFALTNDTNPPANGSVALGNVSPAGIAYQASAGSAIYYRGSAAGQFALSDPITDAESGPASVEYPTVTASGWTHADETVATGTSYTSSTYSWTAGSTTAPSSTDMTLVQKDNGDNQSTQVVPIVNDTTAPSGGAFTVNGSPAAASPPTSYASGSFTISARTDYTDSGSGLASSALTRQFASFNGSGGCGSYGSSTPISGTLPITQSGLADGCYLYTLTGTDNVGNTAAVSAVVEVDAIVPTSASLTDPGANLPGPG